LTNTLISEHYHRAAIEQLDGDEDDDDRIYVDNLGRDPGEYSTWYH
jgi:hypothetical protein